MKKILSFFLFTLLCSCGNVSKNNSNLISDEPHPEYQEGSFESEYCKGHKFKQNFVVGNVTEEFSPSSESEVSLKNDFESFCLNIIEKKYIQAAAYISDLVWNEVPDLTGEEQTRFVEEYTKFFKRDSYLLPSHFEPKKVVMTDIRVMKSINNQKVGFIRYELLAQDLNTSNYIHSIKDDCIAISDENGKDWHFLAWNEIGAKLICDNFPTDQMKVLLEEYSQNVKAEQEELKAK